MGDNRTNSEDSRYFGPISGNLIVGKMAFVVWPLSDLGWIVLLSAVAVVLVVLMVAVALGPRRSTPPPVRRRSAALRSRRPG